MKVSVPTAIPGLLEIVQTGQYPQAAFAAQAIEHWAMSQGGWLSHDINNGFFVELDLPITWQELWQLTSQSVHAEFNRCMSAAPTDKQAFIRACAFVQCTKLANRDYFMSCQWHHWEGYDEQALAEWPDMDMDLFGGGYLSYRLPCAVVDLVHQHADLTLHNNPFRAMSNEVRGYLYYHEAEFSSSHEALEQLVADYTATLPVSNPSERVAAEIRKQTLLRCPNRLFTKEK